LGYAFFIARRVFSEEGLSFSRPFIRISVISVATGVAVMILAVAIVTGFQNEVSQKVTGFGAHYQVTGYDLNTSYEPSPISLNQPFYPSMDTLKGIRHIQVFAQKAGIIRTKDQIEGVVLKGIAADFDWTFFSDKIVAGKPFTLSDTARSNALVISKYLSDRLRLRTGDPVNMYFLVGGEAVPRGRKFTVSGIYETGLEEFDRLYVLGDLRHIQKLNNWHEDQVGGFEILLDDFGDIDRMKNKIQELVGYRLQAESIKDLQPQIYEWLKLHDTNALIILVLMVVVACISMVSILLILVLEKTTFIGILKALGSTSRSIRKIFITQAILITFRGLLWGNVLALALCYLQLMTGLVTLNQESYYVSVVPVHLNVLHLLLMDAGTLILCTLSLFVPSYVVTKIAPLHAIRMA
jgi:lipoprotein-releasing system permease protein